MKKLILIFLFVATSLQAQWFTPNPKGLLRLNNTWTGTQTFGALTLKTITNPSQIIFDSGDPIKVAMGLIGTPEANMSFNMDYSTRYHRYYDSTQNALWWTLNVNGAYLQYAPKNYTNDTTGGDMWTRSGSQVPFAVDTNGNTKFNGTLRLGGIDKTGTISTTNTAIYVKPMTTNKLIDYTSTPADTSTIATGISQNISLNTSQSAYGFLSTLANINTGKVWNIYASGGYNYFSGWVSTGRETPTVRMDIYNGSSGATFRSGTQLGIENNGRAIFNILTPSANDAYIMFGSNVANNRAWLSYDHATDIMTLYSAGTIALSNPTKVTGYIAPSADNTYTNGTSGLGWSNTFTKSFNVGIDSTGVIEDSVYIGRYIMLVNCGASDSNVVWLSDYNVTEGQEYKVKKIDANATNVIVKSKTGFTIDGAISKIWNTQYQTYTFVYRNKTWYIL